MVVGRSVGWLVDRENCGVDGISIEDGGSKGKEKMVELEEEEKCADSYLSQSVCLSCGRLAILRVVWTSRCLLPLFL